MGITEITIIVLAVIASLSWGIILSARLSEVKNIRQKAI